MGATLFNPLSVVGAMTYLALRDKSKTKAVKYLNEILPELVEDCFTEGNVECKIERTGKKIQLYVVIKQKRSRSYLEEKTYFENNMYFKVEKGCLKYATKNALPRASI